MKKDKHELFEDVSSYYKIKSSKMKWVKPIKMSQHQKEIFHEWTNYEPVESNN
ncbi:hypothetical protein ABES35_17130 [Bacillus subtilis]|uniref:hypothetical protein n=1 Tax=Bacillus subtilis TaxID=1423 RepID=UPI0013626CD5|nr:hypothetical protein [Bacillus subtilis]MEC2403386.1 hypothetical protein [Bacillus subtilis]MED4659363.1 hypothetical protein [Bacillus subtilis]MED4663667.1 hypothetical protein [Bacillus subtilis]NCT23940.1 hypothetical protein [Bacillus subtilis subsp. subtilis]QHM05678.1 hypothetical protein C7M27_01615 [Bacillus subtilis]